MVTEAAAKLITDTPHDAPYTRFELMRQDGHNFDSQSFAIYDDPKYAATVLTTSGRAGWTYPMTQVAIVTSDEAREIWARSAKVGMKYDHKPFRQECFGPAPAKAPRELAQAA